MWQTFEDMIAQVNRAGLAWTDLLGQRFNGVLDLSNAKSLVMPTSSSAITFPTAAWTPIDSSGAGLALTTPTGTYTKLGNIVIATASFTYPATANGAQSAIGGFPFTCANLQEARAGVLSYHNGATAVKFIMTNNTTFGQFYTAAGVAVTNLQMSTTLSYIQAIYRI